MLKRPLNDDQLEASQPSIKKKKKRKKNPDGAYRKGDEKRVKGYKSKNPRGSIRHLRSKKTKTVVTENGKETSFKFSVRVKEDFLNKNMLTPTKITAKLTSTFKEYEGFCSPQKGESFVIANTPDKINIANDEVLYLNQKQAGGLYILTNIKPLPPIDISIPPDFVDSEAYKNMSEPQSNVKRVIEVVSAESIKKAKKENSEKSGRGISHGKIMSRNGQYVSANDYGKAAGIPLGQEYCHLGPHAYNGKSSQTAKNLVPASKHTNTNQLNFHEAVYEELSKVYPQFTVEHIAKLISNNKVMTQFAETISTTITTKDLVLTYNYVGQDPNESLLIYYLVHRDFIQAILEAKSKLQAHDVKKPVSQVNSKANFFQTDQQKSFVVEEKTKQTARKKITF